MFGRDISWRRDLALLFLAIGSLFAIGLGALPFIAPSEARYIEIPRQMVTTGDWLTPRINGVPYFEKPPLFYWMQAASLSLLGISEISGRLMPLLIVTFTCLITYALGRLYFGRLAGLLAAGVLATSFLGYASSRIAVLDAPVALFITAAIACFLAAQKTSERRRLLYLLMYVFAALAMMTKGLIGVVIPGLVIGAWILITKQWRILKEAQLLPGIAIFLLIAAPWHVMMQRLHPEFFDFYFIHEHFTRYLTSEHKRTAPWWFFIAITAVGMLPWSGLLPAIFKRMRFSDPVALFFALWILLPLLFFSASHSKLASYIFPIFPAIAILLGKLLAEWWEAKTDTRLLRRNIIFIVIVFVVAVIALPLLPSLPGKLGRKLAMLNTFPFVTLLPMAAGLLGLLYVVIRKRSARTLIKALMLFGALTGITVNYAATRFDRNSVKPLAEKLAPLLKENDTVVALNTYWQDLPVYLNRNIVVAGWTGELTFGVEHTPATRAWMISSAEFWQRCGKTKHAVYVFIDESTLNGFSMPADCRLRPIANYGRTLLLKRD